VLDVVRAQGVGLDDFFARWTNRVLHRDASALALGPPALVGAASIPAPGTVSGPTRPVGEVD
jgi:hypothetical protein